MKFYSRRNFRNFKTSGTLIFEKEIQNKVFAFKTKASKWAYFVKNTLIEVLKLLKFFQVENFIEEVGRRKMPKVVSVFQPESDSNEYAIVEEAENKAILCPMSTVETFRCSLCTFETGYPFRMLVHLRDQHGMDKMTAIHVFVNREKDHFKECFEYPKGKIPEGVRIVELKEA